MSIRRRPKPGAARSPSPDAASRSGRVAPAPVRQPAAAAQPSAGPAPTPTTAAAPIDHGRRLHDHHHRRRYRAFACSNRAGNHRAGAGRAADDPVRRRQRRANQSSTCVASAHSRPPIRWFSSTAAGSTTSIWRASIFRPFRAIRSSASKSPGAIAAPCCTATTPSAASSTSSPRSARAVHRSPPASRPAVGSFNQRQVAASASSNTGPWSTSFYGTPDQFRRIPQQQYAGPAQRHRRYPLHHARLLGFPDAVRRRPAARISRRQAGRSVHRRQSAGHRPQGRGHAVRLRRKAGRQRHRRLHQDPVERRRTDRRWRRARQEAAGQLLRRRSAVERSSSPTSMPNCRRGR